MLIHFKVENFLSFDEEQMLSMVRGQSRGHKDHVYNLGDLEILKTAAIFGANASGKTNIIKSIGMAKNFIMGLPFPNNEYFKINENNAKEPSSFEFKISIGERVYSYGFEILLSAGEIRSEWLYDLTKKASVKMFYNHDGKSESDLNLKKDDKARFDVYRNDAARSKNRLLLTDMASRSFVEDSIMFDIVSVFNWFRDDLRVISAGQLPGFILSDSRLDFTSKVLSSYGTGVKGLHIADMDNLSYQIPVNILNDIGHNAKMSGNKDGIVGILRGNDLILPVVMENGEPVIKKLVFDHNGSIFDSWEESDGTNRLFDLLPIINDDGEKDITYVIDELDRSLHPQLTQKFVSDFERLDPNIRRQLILTTHESRLMDLDLLRRDEIWFVDKKNTGNSELYSLEEFSERNDRKIDRSYLDGRYGGVPFFKN